MSETSLTCLNESLQTCQDTTRDCIDDSRDAITLDDYTPGEVLRVGPYSVEGKGHCFNSDSLRSFYSQPDNYFVFYDVAGDLWYVDERLALRHPTLQMDLSDVNPGNCQVDRQPSVLSMPDIPSLSAYTHALSALRKALDVYCDAAWRVAHLSNARNALAAHLRNPPVYFQQLVALYRRDLNFAMDRLNEVYKCYDETAIALTALQDDIEASTFVNFMRHTSRTTLGNFGNVSEVLNMTLLGGAMHYFWDLRGLAAGEFYSIFKFRNDWQTACSDEVDTREHYFAVLVCELASHMRLDA
jgi:hypothetical protein